MFMTTVIKGVVQFKKILACRYICNEFYTVDLPFNSPLILTRPPNLSLTQPHCSKSVFVIQHEHNKYIVSTF